MAGRLTIRRPRLLVLALVLIVPPAATLGWTALHADRRSRLEQGPEPAWVGSTTPVVLRYTCTNGIWWSDPISGIHWWAGPGMHGHGTLPAANLDSGTVLPGSMRIASGSTAIFTSSDGLEFDLHPDPPETMHQTSCGFREVDLSR